MSWDSNNSPWGAGGNRGGRGGNDGKGGGPNNPWGRPNGGGNGSGPPPDMEDLVRKGQEKLRQAMPNGMGGKGLALIIIIGVAVWLSSGFYRVQPAEEGIELVFGELTSRTGPGLNFNWPSPVGEVIKPEVAAVNQVDIGFQELSGGTLRAVPAEGLMLTGDENIVAVGFSVFWKIREAQNYLFNVRNPTENVKNASEAAMREIVGKSGFEYIRTIGRNAVVLSTKDRIQEILDSYGVGIEVTEVTLRTVEPPEEIIDAFRDVQAAKADRERLINEATAYFNEVTQKAEGEAQRILRAAEAYKEERVNLAVGDTERFLSILSEFETAPDITKRRIYLQTMEEILETMDKVLIENGGGGEGSNVLPYLPLDRLVSPQRNPVNGRSQ